MRRSVALLLILIPGVVIITTGCSDKSDQIITPSFSSDKEYFESILKNDDFFKTEEPSLGDGDAFPAEYNFGFMKTEGLIYPLKFGKKIEKVERETSYEQQGDSVVIATITKTISGNFIIVASRDTGRSRRDTVIRKPFVETATRKARFIRVAPNDRPPWKGWKLDGLSLLEGGTNNTDVVINRLVLRLAGGDSIVVTSPNDYFLKVGKHPRPVPEWKPDEQARIQLTLASTSSDTEHVFLRHGASSDGFHRIRSQFHLVSQTQVGSLYLRTFELTVKAHKYPGKFNAVAEAITHGSIYDDVAAFKNDYWGIPYLVHQ